MKKGLNYSITSQKVTVPRSAPEEVIQGLPVMEREEINQLNGLVEKRKGIKGPKNSFHLISAVIIAD